MINYGYANGWKETPEQVKRCRELKHPIQTVKIGNCLTEYICPTCGYEYKIDSGD